MVNTINKENDRIKKEESSDEDDDDDEEPKFEDDHKQT